MSADENNAEESAKSTSGSMIKIVIWLVVAIISIGGGFAAPIVIAQLNDPAAETEPADVYVPDPEEESEYIDFQEVIVNLSEQQFSRYLKLNFSLEVPKSQKLEIEKKIEARKAVLLDRINAHFAEVKTEDLKGKFGQNRIRRTMHGYFNEILFDDGIERITDILFRGLHVQ